MPGAAYDACYSVNIAKGTAPGRYMFSVALFETTILPERIIEIGFKEALRCPDGYYRLAEIELRSL